MQCGQSCMADSELKMVRGGRAEAHGPRSDVSFRGEENLLPFGYEWYCVVLYLVLGLGLQYLLYFVLYT